MRASHLEVVRRMHTDIHGIIKVMGLLRCICSLPLRQKAFSLASLSYDTLLREPCAWLAVLPLRLHDFYLLSKPS